MNLWEAIRVALGALSANKLRSALTMLGMVIGVSAVIAVVAIGQGGQLMVLSELESFGSSRTLWIHRDHETDTARSVYSPLTPEDAHAIKEALPDELEEVTAVSGVWFGGQRIVGYKKNTTRRISIDGVEGESYRRVNNLRMAAGRFIGEKDNQNLQPVAVIDEKSRDKLFGTEDPLGKEIRVGAGRGTQYFTVVGVARSPTGMLSSLDGDRGDVYLPIRLLTILMNRGTQEIDQIQVLVRDPRRQEEVGQRIVRLLRLRHHGTGNYLARAYMADLMKSVNRVTGIMALVISGIAAISLLVGGIGIMNIMLVSVTERTREIGIRKAMGARRRDILIQFLVEAVVLSVLGGAIGILLGVGGGQAFQAGIRVAFPDIDFHLPVSWSAVTLATSIAAAIGIFFGLYPAYRASRLDPVEALRYE